MNVSIIIVSWNVRNYLKKCLDSLKGASMEVIVVDNGSHDGSSSMIRKDYPSVKLIENPTNRGFAAACNQGAAIAEGKHFFFLNPDTEVPPNAIDILSNYLASHEKVGIVAPRIQYPDGTAQISLRRFPRPLDQLLKLFKLDRLFRRVPAFQSYFGDDIDYTAPQDVEQPMGAALMVKKRLFNELQGFDERFFIWFEEVDFCKRAKDAGWQVRYIPESRIIHASAKSFSQHAFVQKQYWYFRSCAQYLEKHFGLRAWYALIPMRIFTSALGVVLKSFSRLFTLVLFSVVSLLLLSYAGYFFPTAQAIGFFGLLAVTAILSFWRLEFGLWIVISELIIGSKGYLFSFTFDSFSLSARMGIFACVLVAWIIHRIRSRNRAPQAAHLVSLGLAFPLAAAGVFVLGVFQGVFIQNGIDVVFRDANGWLYALLLPVFCTVLSDRKSFIRLATVAGAAIFAQTLFVLLVFYVMGHQGFGFDAMYSLYRWIRTTGLGEVTQMSFGFTRVFFQSQIFIGIALALCFSGLTILKRTPSVLYGALILLFSSLIVGLSRSFWIAAFTASLVWLLALIAFRIPTLWRLAGTAIACAVGGFLLLFTIAIVPYPSQEQGFGFDALTARLKNLDSESAAVSRWKLLPILLETVRERPLFGHGFGKTVTYLSHDPRVMKDEKPAPYTTYAFEWGYVDFAVKVGLIGLTVLMFCLGMLFKKLFWTMKILRQRNDPWWVVAWGLLLGYVFLLATHFFTPYLTHPLGLGFLLVIIAFIRVFVQEDAYIRE